MEPSTKGAPPATKQPAVAVGRAARWGKLKMDVVDTPRSEQRRLLQRTPTTLGRLLLTPSAREGSIANFTHDLHDRLRHGHTVSHHKPSNYAVYREQMKVNPVPADATASLQQLTHRRRLHTAIARIDDCLSFLAVSAILLAIVTVPLGQDLRGVRDGYFYTDAAARNASMTRVGANWLQNDGDALLAASVRLALKWAAGGNVAVTWALLVVRLWVEHRTKTVRFHQPPSAMLFCCGSVAEHQAQQQPSHDVPSCATRCRAHNHCVHQACCARSVWRTLLELVAVFPHCPVYVERTFVVAPSIVFGGQAALAFGGNIVSVPPSLRVDYNIFGLFVVVRLYQLMRTIKTRSGFGDAHSEFRAKMHGIDTESFAFHFKMLVRSNPIPVMLSIAVGALVVFAAPIWCIEREYRDYSLDTALWSVIAAVTPLPMGSGALPLTIAGRGIMLLSAVSGSFVLGSLITAVFVGFTVLEQREVDFCLNHANKNWVHDTRLTAVSVLQTAVRWHWAKKLSHTANAASRTTAALKKKKPTASAKVSSSFGLSEAEGEDGSRSEDVELGRADDKVEAKPKERARRQSSMIDSSFTAKMKRGRSFIDEHGHAGRDDHHHTLTKRAKSPRKRKLEKSASRITGFMRDIDFLDPRGIKNAAKDIKTETRDLLGVHDSTTLLERRLFQLFEVARKLRLRRPAANGSDHFALQMVLSNVRHNSRELAEMRRALMSTRQALPPPVKPKMLSELTDADVLTADSWTKAAAGGGGAVKAEGVDGDVLSPPIAAPLAKGDAQLSAALRSAGLILNDRQRARLLVLGVRSASDLRWLNVDEDDLAEDEGALTTIEKRKWIALVQSLHHSREY